MFVTCLLTGTQLINFTHALTEALGPSLHSVTHLELYLVSQSQGRSSGEVFASDATSIITNFACCCKALTRITIHGHMHVRQGRRPILLDQPQIHVATLVGWSQLYSLKQLTHLELSAHMREGGSAYAHMLLPLDDEDMVSLGRCSRLTHLSLQTSVTSDIKWTALPATLESLTLLTVKAGPQPGTHLPNLKRFKLHFDCAAKDVALLLRCAPMLESMQVRDLIAFTWPESVENLRSIQEYNQARASSTAKSASTSLLARTDRSSSCSLGLADVNTYGAFPSSPSVQARRIKLLAPETHGLSFSDFLQQMQPMFGYRFLSIARLNTSGPPLGAADPFLFHMANAFPDLGSLLVKRCSLADTDLLLLSECTKLQAVHLGGCRGLTGAGVVGLAKTAKGLLVLEAHGCRGVNPLAKAVVQKRLRLRLIGSKVDDKTTLLKVQNSRKCRNHHRSLAVLNTTVAVCEFTIGAARAWACKRCIKFTVATILRIPKARAHELVEDALLLHAGIQFIRWMARV